MIQLRRMKKKIILLIILLALLILTGTGFFIWNRFFKAKAEIQSKADSEKTQAIPKVAEYKVPILMYHYIRDASGETEMGKKLSVSPENFRAQLQWLKGNNYQPIIVSDLADPQKATISKVYFDKKSPIVFTFDDGYKDAYTQAFPLLKEYGFIGTFYIIKDYIGKGNYMSQSEIDELQKAGNEIGSHTLTHPDLTNISLEEARKQIFDSKGSATAFCYPSGKYNDAIIALVKEASYLTAVTTHSGIANQNSDLFHLPRVRVEDGDGEVLKNKINSALNQ